MDADNGIKSRVMAIAQDIVFAISRGRVVLPKHLALSMATRHLTRSSHLVSVLNRFGHGVSDSKLHEIETAAAERTLSQAVPVPTNIKPGNGTVYFCWDNNDLTEETLSGAGTTHCTNGIVIQNPPPAVASNADPLSLNTPPAIPGRKKRPARSLTVVQQQLPQYISGARPEPSVMTMPIGGRTTVFAGNVMSLDSDDLLWLMLRSSDVFSRFGRASEEPQQVPGWTKFHSVMYDDIAPKQASSIGYLPVIPAPPTEHSTILEVLNRSVALTRRFGQRHCIITGDQAIYAKALDVLLKHENDFGEVVLRLGAFHTACAFECDREAVWCCRTRRPLNRVWSCWS